MPVRTRRAPVVVAGAALLVALAGCGGGSDSTSAASSTVAVIAAPPAVQGVPTLVSPAQAAALLAAAAPPVLIDVRTAAEFDAGHLEGATVLDLRGGQFQQQVGTLDKAATYLVYCHSGNRSAQATAMMKQLGFTKVYELQGGIIAWQQAGQPTVR